MILEEVRIYRDGDTPQLTSAGNKTYHKRIHFRVKCDICLEERLAIKHSFMQSSCYHKNNSTNQDFCKRCRINWQMKSGLRAGNKRYQPNFSEFHPTKTIKYAPNNSHQWLC